MPRRAPIRPSSNPRLRQHAQTRSCPSSFASARPTTRTTSSPNIASDPSYRVPIFNAATFTDPLFPPSENRRMLNRLRVVVPDYPIQAYHGDYQHFVQNKAKEWGDLCQTAPTSPRLRGSRRLPGRLLQRRPDEPRCAPGVDHEPEPLRRPLRAAVRQPDRAAAERSTSPPRFRSAPRTPAPDPGRRARPDASPRRRSKSSRRTRSDSTWTGDQPTTSDVRAESARRERRPARQPRHQRQSLPRRDAARRPRRRLLHQRPLLARHADDDRRDRGDRGLHRLPGRHRRSSSTRASTTSSPSGTAVLVDRGPRRVSYGRAARPARSPTSCTAMAGASPGHRVRIEIAQDDDPFVQRHSTFLDGARRRQPANPGPRGRLGERRPRDPARRPARGACDVPKTRR